MCEGVQRYQVLVNRGLLDCDSSWFDDLDSRLLAMAKASEPGRRYLARHLKSQLNMLDQVIVLPATISDATAETRSLIPDEGLLGIMNRRNQAQETDKEQANQEQADTKPHFIEVLGALLCVPLLRINISREVVWEMTQVLGTEYYKRVLKFQPDVSLGNQGNNEQLEQFRNLLGQMLTFQNTQEELNKIAYIGLTQYAQKIHAYAEDRVKVMFNKSFVDAIDHEINSSDAIWRQGFSPLLVHDALIYCQKLFAEDDPRLGEPEKGGDDE